MQPQLNFFGEIRTPYQHLSECPANIQPDGPACQLILRAGYAAELKGLAAGQQVLLLYWLGQPAADSYLAGGDPGIFALRTPLRPNPIGAAVLTIQSVSGNQLTVNGLDCLNGTQLLDIKPAIFKETGI